MILFCNATGEPAPNITWTKENGNDGEEVFSGNPLVIVNVGRNDTGTYRCTANNGIGKPVSRSLYVNITCKYKNGSVCICKNLTMEMSHVTDSLDTMLSQR